MIVSADIHTRAHAGATQPTLVELVEPRAEIRVGIAPGTTGHGRLTGEYVVVHLYRGVAYRLSDEAGCVVCARKAARSAAESGVDWGQTPAGILTDPVATYRPGLAGGPSSQQDAHVDCDDLPEAATAGGYEAVRLP
jgi:hypothetical protein